MHALHTILVRKEEKNNTDDIRRFAATETERYADLAYDWRETSSAGRWMSEFPDNVLHLDEKPEVCLSLLNSVLDTQESIIKEAPSIKPSQAYSREEGRAWNWHELWKLGNAVDLLNGRYTFDSMFYDTENYTSLLTGNRVNDIMGRPEEYALVLFDYHI